MLACYQRLRPCRSTESLNWDKSTSWADGNWTCGWTRDDVADLNTVRHLEGFDVFLFSKWKKQKSPPWRQVFGLITSGRCFQGSVSQRPSGLKSSSVSRSLISSVPDCWTSAPAACFTVFPQQRAQRAVCWWSREPVGMGSCPRAAATQQMAVAGKESVTVCFQRVLLQHWTTLPPSTVCTLLEAIFSSRWNTRL